MNKTAWEIGEILRSRKLTLGCVESATGGLISATITEIAGSSDYFKGAIVSYSNRAKISLVGVSKETLEKHGAVSPRVAEEMAFGGRKVLSVDICLSDTGIAGPGGATEKKPVGLFYIGLSHKDGTFNRRLNLNGDREQNREAAVKEALSWLKEYLSEIE